MQPLTDLLSQHEGKVLEFKRDLSSPDPIIRTIVAFANGAGGEVLVGVEDRTRYVRGVSNPPETEEQIANLISDRIEPRLAPEIQIVPWKKNHIILVRVFPSGTRPHFVKALGPEQGVYVRVGSTNRRADPAQIDELRRLTRGRTFDEEPLPNLGIDAIDFRAAADCFAPTRKLKPGDLRSLQMTTHHQHRDVPTVGGILLFGTDRLAHFPEAFLRAGCFGGRDRTQIIDSVDIKTHLPLVVEEALHFVKRNTRRALSIEGAKHAEAWEFPLVAIREAVINALVHADYAQRGAPLRLAIFSDRIEIDNPGGLLPGITIDDIRRGISKLRNRVMGRVFHELGLIEQWGSGIQRLTEACMQAGLPSPLLEEIGSGFRVTFLRGGDVHPKLDDLDQAILDFVGRSPSASMSQIAQQIQRTSRTARTRVNHLVELGLLAAIGSNSRDPRRTFQVTTKRT
jgi:predicted HTH transcriptional regulator